MHVRAFTRVCLCVRVCGVCAWMCARGAPGLLPQEDDNAGNDASRQHAVNPAAAAAAAAAAAVAAAAVQAAAVARVLQRVEAAEKVRVRWSCAALYPSSHF